MQITARWDPSEACKPDVDEAPIFYPTAEVTIRLAKWIQYQSFKLLKNQDSPFLNF